MKKVHFLAIGMIILAGVVLMNAASDVSSYATFEKAKSSGDRVKIAGALVKNRPMNYDPEKNENLFSFYLDDGTGDIQKVILTKPKPQDFEMSEQIVVTGTYNKDNTFVADEILMKCPSKYKGQEISIKEG